MGGSLRYFTLGNITFTDEVGTQIRDFKPNEFSLDMSFGQKFSEQFSGGIAIRYIYSNLTGGQNVLGADSKPGMGVAADVSAFYSNKRLNVNGRDARLNIGANISNVGNKMRYTNSDKRDFIPTNLRLGTAFTIDLDKYNQITTLVDFSKLLVPTPPRYNLEGDSILAGLNPDVGVATGMVQSFYDAPGDVSNEGTIIPGTVFREELREINGAVAISIDLVDHVLELSLSGVLAEGAHDGAKLFGGDGAIAVLVEQGEGLLELGDLMERKMTWSVGK
jgi:hypothetical protein